MEYQIRSLLKTGKGASDFVNVDAFEGKLADKNYIKGAIEWSIGDTTILSDANWDIVDLLWFSILDGLLEMRKKDIAEVHFPSQPLSLLFTTIPPRHARIRFLGFSFATVVDRSIMIRSLCDGARSFFCKMSLLAPELKGKWDDGLKKVDEVESQFQPSDDIADTAP